MAGWGLEGSQAWMLGCFFDANVTYNLGLVFYNTLLPSVATEERVGLVSGIGVGVGYFGTILVLLALLLPLHVATHQFLAAAAIFLVGALPCLLLVRDRRQPTRGSSPVVREALGSLSRTLRELPAHRPLMWFLLANFCLVDVLNTAVLFFASFTKNVFATSARDGTLQLFGHVYLGDDGLKEFFGLAGLCLNSLALVFGIALGALTDRRPLQVMRWSGVGLFVALAGGAWFGGSSALGYLLTLVLFGAAGLSGIWTAGRKIVVMLAPRERVGEYFGLYGITMKLSVLGSTVYGLVSDTFGTRPAMLAQSAQLLIGLGCLAMVRLPERRDLPR
jgi:UMF1 family MFS transporter